MSQSTGTPTATAAPQSNAKSSTPQGEGNAANRVAVDESKLQTQYANFCRVTGTPEELLVDFGLNAQPTGGQGNERVEVNQRIVLNFYTAKRLLAAMNMAIQRHEGLFGEIETNPQKRVRQQPQG